MPPMELIEKGIILCARLDCLSVAQLGEVRLELEKVVARMEESSQIMLICVWARARIVSGHPGFRES